MQQPKWYSAGSLRHSNGHGDRARETARDSKTDSRTMALCTLLQQLQKRSFNFKIVCLQFQYEPSKREFTCQQQQQTQGGGGEVGWGIRAGVGAAVRGGVVVSPSKAVRQLDCEYESCMQICQNDYFSFCNCLASKRERQGERGRGRGRGTAGYLGLARGVGSASTFPLI